MLHSRSLYICLGCLLFCVFKLFWTLVKVYRESSTHGINPFFTADKKEWSFWVSSLDYKEFHCKKALGKASSDLHQETVCPPVFLPGWNPQVMAQPWPAITSHAASPQALWQSIFNITWVTKAWRLIKIKLNP